MQCLIPSTTEERGAASSRSTWRWSARPADHIAQIHGINRRTLWNSCQLQMKAASLPQESLSSHLLQEKKKWDTYSHKYCTKRFIQTPSIIARKWYDPKSIRRQVSQQRAELRKFAPISCVLRACTMNVWYNYWFFIVIEQLLLFLCFSH